MRVGEGVGFSAILITCSNIIVPEVCKLLNKQETYDTDGQSQISLYIKIALVRWVNTALLIFILSGHDLTITNADSGIIAKVNALLLSELVLTPLIRAADLLGSFKKHVLAPRCSSQTEMNLKFPELLDQ